MNKNKNKKNKNRKSGLSEKNEDTTKYGEFVSSYFNWTTLDKQKETAEDLENITKDK